VVRTTGLGVVTGGTTTFGAVVVIGGNVVGELGVVAVVLGGATVVLGVSEGVVVGGASVFESNVLVTGVLMSGASSLPPKTASSRIPTRITAPASTQASFRLACLVAVSSGRRGGIATGGLGIGGSFGISVVACSPSGIGSGAGAGGNTAPGAWPLAPGAWPLAPGAWPLAGGASPGGGLLGGRGGAGGCSGAGACGPDWPFTATGGGGGWAVSTAEGRAVVGETPLLDAPGLPLSGCSSDSSGPKDA
jgi:hypothetical protein